jgi:hypothetical protein
MTINGLLILSDFCACGRRGRECPINWTDPVKSVTYCNPDDSVVYLSCAPKSACFALSGSKKLALTSGHRLATSHHLNFERGSRPSAHRSLQLARFLLADLDDAAELAHRFGQARLLVAPRLP